MDCEALFLKTLHTSDQWTLWKSFVGFRCRIGVNFAILFTSKEKFSTAGRCGAARADQRWLRAGSGGIFRAPDKGNFPGTPDVGNRSTKSGIPVSCQSEQEVVLQDFTRNLQQQERQTVAGSAD